MEAQSLILGILIAALAAVIVFWPFVSARREETVSRPVGQAQEVKDLIARRDAIYAIIRDLDFDFETGKLTEEDYRAQRQTWIEQGVAALKALDALTVGVPVPARNGHPVAEPAVEPNGDLEARIEAAVAARRRTTA